LTKLVTVNGTMIRGVFQFQELSFEKIRVKIFNLITWCKSLDSLAI